MSANGKEASEKIIHFIQNNKIKMSLIYQARNNAYKKHEESDEYITDEHPFHNLFLQPLFPLNEKTSETQISHKIHKLLDTAQAEFSPYLDQIHLKPILNEGIFRTYLLSQQPENSFQCLLNELTSFYLMLLNKKENPKIIQQAFSIFPPNDKEDYGCVPGMRIRLMNTIKQVKAEMSDTENNLIDNINNLIVHFFDDYIQQAIFKFKLNEDIYTGNEIHLISFLDYLLGVNKNIITEKYFFYSPHKKIY